MSESGSGGDIHTASLGGFSDGWMGDAAFSRELEAAINPLRADARMLTQNAADLDDLVQQTLLKAWKARRTFRQDRNFKGWLFVILRNCFYEECRRARVRRARERLLAPVASCAPSQEDAVSLRNLARRMNLLPSAQKQALVAATIGGKSHAEIAESTGVSVGAVKSRVCRARQALLH
ncbi:RNA polymerase sigma factor [Brevundimonas sp. 2R-24]|uniref:RNA polymerase sigma factor n=1 Tax=Peiella sedimenti TaxID=3061083 RepID=A0ABT8SQI0_9CAUL|nr:RNA polymerase sigma factor [Caulobacteraceae bacterium XZ-24]